VQDEYATYELLAPETNAFRTDYEVAVTSAGATVFYDRIGSGLQSVPPAIGGSDRAIDLMTGDALKVEQKGDYLEVRLARPVPSDGGQARPAHRQDLQGPEKLLPRGRHDCVQPIDRSSPRGVCAAGRVSAGRVQRAGAGAVGGRWPDSPSAS
jgi:hypothetical protein